VATRILRAMATAERVQTEELTALVLNEAERAAVLRVFHVVEDNFWLDDLERSVLERLLDTPTASDGDREERTCSLPYTRTG
jgi:hypothetical protein